MNPNDTARIRRRNDPLAFAAAMACLAALAVTSLFIGVGDLSPRDLFGENGEAVRLLLVSRIPRTAAVLLAGMAVGVAAVIMQTIFRNRFVEPTTSGTVEAASLGLVAVALLQPAMPLPGKMLVAAGFALASTWLFLKLIDRIAVRTAVIVPLLGLMLGRVLESLTFFIAYRHDLLQALVSWVNGDFSSVLRGRYELLWIGAGLAALAYVAADRFTVAGMGRSTATGLGLDYRRVVGLGLAIVSMVTAAVVVTVGTVPFLGLIVANLVTMVTGDNLRRALPWIALAGAGFMLACDIAGRLIRFPYEIPVGTVAGVVGSAAFLAIILSRRRRLG